MSDFSFIECSYNPLDISYDDVNSSLNRLGFVLVNTNITGNVSVWMQNLCIMLLRQDQCAPTFAVSGLGFLCSDNTIIDTLGAEYDDDTGMYVCQDGCALRTLLVTEDESFTQFGSLESDYITAVTINKNVKYSGITHISGIVYDCADESVLNHYYELGFELQKESDDYYTLLSQNKRLTILCNKHKMKKHINTVICETEDVFYTTAFFTNLKMELKKYDLSYIQDDMFGDVTHKIIGYNCLAHGTKNNHSVENMVNGIAPNLNVLFRMRKQHANINEEVFLKHFEDNV